MSNPFDFCFCEHCLDIDKRFSVRVALPEKRHVYDCRKGQYLGETNSFDYEMLRIPLANSRRDYLADDVTAWSFTITIGRRVGKDGKKGERAALMGDLLLGMGD